MKAEGNVMVAGSVMFLYKMLPQKQPIESFISQ